MHQVARTKELLTLTREPVEVGFAGSDAGGTRSPSLRMASIKGLAAYKKKDGTLSISKDQRSIVWLPVGARDADRSVSIPVASITSMWSSDCWSSRWS